MTMPATLEPPPHLAPLVGRIVGFVDTHEHLEEVLRALQPLGFSSSKIVVFSGEPGLQAVEKLSHEISMNDDETELLRFCRSELHAGHFGMEIQVKDHKEARLVSEVATPFQARHFTYFGPWFTLRIT